MVRYKNSPARSSTKAEMTLDKCKSCELVINRKGEKRPAIRCKTCNDNVCYQCAGLETSLCEMMRNSGQALWECSSCGAKSADLKSVLDSIQNIHSEMVVIKQNQDGQKVEQERMLEGIKKVETVVKRMEVIEKVQADHGKRLDEQEVRTQKNTKNIDETEQRTSAVERRLERLEADGVSVKQTNAIIRELRAIDRADRNFLIANLPESKEEEAVARKKEDEKLVAEILKELNLEQIKPVKVLRVGFGGRYPKKVLVILNSVEECEKTFRKAETTVLSNNVWLARDRTWNQREEGRLMREEKAQEEAGDSAPKRGRPGGAAKSVGRLRGSGGNGSVRGRGSKQDDSRKRRGSGDDNGTKWSRTGERGGGRGKGGGRGASGGRGGKTAAPSAVERDGSPIGERDPLDKVISSVPDTPESDSNSANQLLKASGRPATPGPGPSSGLGAAGSSEELF